MGEEKREAHRVRVWRDERGGWRSACSGGGVRRAGYECGPLNLPGLDWQAAYAYAYAHVYPGRSPWAGRMSG